MKFSKLGKLIMVVAVIAIISIVAFAGYASEKKSEIQGKTVTIVDDTGRKVAVHVPIKTFVYHGHNCYLYEMLRALGVEDRVIGVSDRFVRPGGYRYSPAYFPELLNVTDVGLLKSPDYELIDKLKPDAVFTDSTRWYDWKKTPDIPVIIMDLRPTTDLTEFKKKVMELAILFNEEKEAKEYIEWHTKWFNEIKKRIEDIPYDKRPLVYIGYYNAVKYGGKTFQVPARDSYRSVIVRMAGGRPLGDEINGSGNINVDVEWVIKRNPDVMMFSISEPYLGYDVTDPSKAKKMIEQFMSRSEFAHVSAVKNKRVYMVSHAYILCGGASGLINSLYLAKWLYPERFADIDPQAVHQEFVTKFQHLNLDVNKTWCVYPKP